MAYLGVVGIGKGRGALGHVFLLVKNSDQPFLLADVYQYNISSKDGTPFSPTNGIAKSNNLVFSLKKQKFLELHTTYTSSENRIISLYELTLNEKEVIKLIGLLDIDQKNLSFPAQHPYGIYNNCVTRPIELINLVVDSSRQIEYIGKGHLFIRDQADFVPALQGALLNRLPFIIGATLQKHPISKGLTRNYESKSTRMARFFTAIHKDLESMQTVCGWSPKIMDSLEIYLSLYVTEPGTYGFEPLLTLSRACPESQVAFKNVILNLYQLVDGKHKQARKQLYDFINQKPEFSQ